MSTLIYALPCAKCGAEFQAGRRDARYCQRCGRDSPTKLCMTAGCEKPLRARGLCNTHYNREYHPDSHRRSPGDPERRRQALRTRTQLRRARRRAPAAEPVVTEVLGRRDGWRCGICRRPVNRALVYPHPRCSSLDHIVPLSEGGEHTYANARLAHLDCNVRRGNRGGDEQLALIG